MSGSEPAATLVAKGSSGRELRVDFALDGDRYLHSIQVVREGEVTEVLRSTEPGENEPIRKCPCFTEIHEQGESLFLTGSSSDRYWSMSVSIEEIDLGRLVEPNLSSIETVDEDVLDLLLKRQGFSAPPSITTEFLSFEVACRMKSERVALHSIYSIAEEYLAIPIVQSLAILSNQARETDPSMNLVIGWLTDKMLSAFRPGLGCSISLVEGAEVDIKPVEQDNGNLPTTIQWRYGVWVM